jgi:uncharacterized phage-associated protein
MIAGRAQEKAFNAITFFVDKTGACNKEKLFKLLWLLDSEHFEAIGRPVTPFHYQAWKMGPVPVELNRAIEGSDPELLARFEIQRQVQRKRFKRFETISFRNKSKFEPLYFSDRELSIMQSLADRFDLATGEEMEQWTHRKGTPWHKVWHQRRTDNEPIPFEYALDKLPEEDRKIILNISREREAFLATLR